MASDSGEDESVRSIEGSGDGPPLKVLKTQDVLRRLADYLDSPRCPAHFRIPGMFDLGDALRAVREGVLSFNGPDLFSD